MGTKLEIVRLSEVESKPIDWLWYPYIPYGKLTMIQGDPGGGKTMLILHLAGLLSSGHPLPFDNENIDLVVEVLGGYDFAKKMITVILKKSCRKYPRISGV